MGRRLFERLQQRVEGILRQHVHFVDDIDLVARRNRRVPHRLDDLAHIVDASVRRGVHLDDVDMPPLGDRHARLAHAARIDRGTTGAVQADAVQRLGDQPCSRRFPDAAHTRHQECMCQPVALDRIAERAHHRVLPDKFRKSLRPVFAREDAVWLRGGHRVGLTG